jgi:hydrogenase maturation protease
MPPMDPTDQMEPSADRTNRRVLVAGIGNIFLTDDGFGVEVAQRLRARPVPDGVRVEDFGIRGVHLAYELLEGYETLVLVDAVPMGEAPGTVALLEPEISELEHGDDPAPTLEAHSMSPGVVLDMLAGLGGRVDRILIVGCEPESVEEGIGLSDVVAASVDRAVEAIDDVLAELCPSASRRDVAMRGEANP